VTAGTTPAGGGGGSTTGTLTPGFGIGTNSTGGMASSGLGPTAMGGAGVDAAAAGLLPCVQLAAFLAVGILSFLAL
jgi:hypothetical protein